MPNAAWDRLADAVQAKNAQPLSVIAIGDVHAEELTALTPHFSRLEQLVLDLPARVPLAAHRAEFNRAVDAASSDWLLIVRGREVVSDGLASEIAAAVAGGKARGFRIRSVPMYCGEPLRLGLDEGDIRLFHRRYYLRFAERGEWQQLAVQGSVVRLEQPLRAMSFASADEHHAQLAATCVRVSKIARVLRFARYAITAGTPDRTTLRYLWVEAAYANASP